jgi:hypothetical protein
MIRRRRCLSRRIATAQRAPRRTPAVLRQDVGPSSLSSAGLPPPVGSRLPAPRWCHREPHTNLSPQGVSAWTRSGSLSSTARTSPGSRSSSERSRAVNAPTRQPLCCGTYVDQVSREILGSTEGAAGHSRPGRSVAGPAHQEEARPLRTGSVEERRRVPVSYADELRPLDDVAQRTKMSARCPAAPTAGGTRTHGTGETRPRPEPTSTVCDPS